MMTEYKNSVRALKFFLIACDIDQLNHYFFKESNNHFLNGQSKFLIQKVKLYSKNSLFKPPTCSQFFFKNLKQILPSFSIYNHNYSFLSKLILEDKTLKRLKQSLDWSREDRKIASNYVELNKLCEDYDAKERARKAIEIIFTLYEEPEASVAPIEKLSMSEKAHDKLQIAYEKLNEDVFHSPYFHAKLLEKLKFGTKYGILTLCPQLFEGLVETEEECENFKACLLDPEILHDKENHTIYRPHNYLHYLDEHAEITANAPEKWALCKLLMRALNQEAASQKNIIDSLTPFRVTETYIGPRPNDRYKYLEYLPEELMIDTEFLITLIIKDHEVFHHIPKSHQEPIKKNLSGIFSQSKDVEFFFNVFGYATEEAKNNFVVCCVAESPTFSYLSKLPENLITTELLLKSVGAVKEHKYNHGDEACALETIYTLAIDKVINSKMTDSEKQSKIEEIEKHRLDKAWHE